MLNNFISKDKYMKPLQLAIFTNNERSINIKKNMPVIAIKNDLVQILKHKLKKNLLLMNI